MQTFLLFVQTFGLLGVAIMGYINRKAIEQVHISINSRMTELLRVTEIAAHAKGATDERSKERKENRP